MAQEQIKQLQQKLEQQQAQFQRYKVQCKELQSFLQGQSTKKQQQIRKLKQQAILKQKSFGPLKAQVSQLESEITKLKTQLSQQQTLAQQANTKKEQLTKTIDEYKSIISGLEKDKEELVAKVSALEAKAEGQKVGGKTKGDAGDSKKLEEAVAGFKAKVAELEKQNDKLREELARKVSVKHEEKKVEHKSEAKDNRQEDRLREKIEKLEKKVSEYHGDLNRSQQKCMKLSKQLKQAKQKLSNMQSQRDNLIKKIKQLSYQSNKKQQVSDPQETDSIIQEPPALASGSPQPHFSALLLTKKHYISPFLQQKSDNSLKLYKNTKNGCFEKSLGSIKYKLNSITYDSEQMVDGCVAKVMDALGKGIKCSVVIVGAKKTSKKYIMGSIVNKLKDFILDKLGQSEEPVQGYFVKASPDPEKRVQMQAHNTDQVQQIFQKIESLCQKSPKKPASSQKIKQAPKPKARYLRLCQGSTYFQLITTSFTGVSQRQNQSLSQALNNITYSRLPNALQPLDTFKYVILTLNPIVSLYDECKNTLAIVNCKKAQNQNDGHAEEYVVGDYRVASPNKEELNDTARKKLQTIERQNQQNHLKIRKNEQQIQFYKSKFDQLQVRLKNLLNTHREQNTYLKKSPVTLSYEKMLKFVHTVQARNSSSVGVGSASKVEQKYVGGFQREYGDPDADEPMHQVDGDDAEDIL